MISLLNSFLYNSLSFALIHVNFGLVNSLFLMLFTPEWSTMIQNRKQGAVTHILVNDPTRGYAVEIEKMLRSIRLEAGKRGSGIPALSVISRHGHRL